MRIPRAKVFKVNGLLRSVMPGSGQQSSQSGRRIVEIRR
jgi:hypothetical protein